MRVPAVIPALASGLLLWSAAPLRAGNRAEVPLLPSSAVGPKAWTAPVLAHINGSVSADALIGSARSMLASPDVAERQAAAAVLRAAAQPENLPALQSELLSASPQRRAEIEAAVAALGSPQANALARAAVDVYDGKLEALDRLFLGVEGGGAASPGVLARAPAVRLDGPRLAPAASEYAPHLAAYGVSPEVAARLEGLATPEGVAAAKLVASVVERRTHGPPLSEIKRNDRLQYGLKSDERGVLLIAALLQRSSLAAQSDRAVEEAERALGAPAGAVRRILAAAKRPAPDGALPEASRTAGGQPQVSRNLREEAWGRRLAYLTEVVRHPTKELMERPEFELLPPAMQAQARGRLRPVSPRAWLDTAVEIETDESMNLLRLLTTTVPGATVAEMLGGGRLPGDGFPTTPGLSKADAGRATWERLNPTDRRKLLVHLAKTKPTSFSVDRKIPGIKVRDLVTLTFKEETTFLGKTYAAGTHEVDVRGLFGDSVEFRSISDQKDFQGVELHFRTALGAANVALDAWKFLDAAGIDRAGMHAHIVAPLPRAEFMAEPVLQTALATEFYRRVNLRAMLDFLIHDRGRLDVKLVRNRLGVRIGVAFASMASEELKRARVHFERLSRGEKDPLGDELKSALVALRSEEKYDAPGLYGLEYRSISSTSEEPDVREALDAVQRALVSRSYARPAAREAMSAWLADHGTAVEAFERAWFNRPWAELFASLPPHVKSRVGPAHQKAWAKSEEKDLEVKLLLHDWSSDPLLYDVKDLSRRKALSDRIAAAQARALDRVNAGGYVQPAALGFLYDSGLYDLVRTSLEAR